MQLPSEKFFCKLSDNTFGIKFGAYRIRDYESGITLIEVSEEEQEKGEIKAREEEEKNPNNTESRLIKYCFGPDFLRLKTIGLQLDFAVGDNPVENLLLVERHYFKGKLIKNYEFKFGFCIPNSKNSWEFIYPMPQFNEEEKADVIASPWETQSDSFFFVGDKLVIHNKA